MNRRFKIMLAWSLCFIMSAALINCGGGDGGVSTVQFVSISVTPANASIPEGMTQQFTATGTYSDSTTKDLTTMVTWSSSPTAIATISNAGLATAVEVGTSTITATESNSGKTGSTTLTVTQVWQSFKSISGTGIYSDQLVIDYADENKLYSSERLSNSGAAIVSYNNNSITSFLPKISITVDPNNNNHLLAISTGYIYESIDGGTSWNIISDANTFGYSDTQLDPNNSYLEHSPDGYVIYCYSQKAGTVIASPGWLFASSVDKGRTWRSPTGLRKGVGVGPIAVSNSNPNIIFARVQENLYKSGDYGLNWQLVSPPSNSYTNGDIAVDPFDQSVVYCINYTNPNQSMKLFKTINGGITWKEISFPNYDNNKNYAINANRYIKGLHYIGVESQHNASILRSTDGGETWVPLNNSLNTALPTGPNGNYLGAGIVSLVSGPKKPDGTVMIYASLSNGSGPYKYIDSP